MKQRRAFMLVAVVLLVFFALCDAWLYVQKQQYDRNHDLIAALQHGDSKSALALVNGGADPNTRRDPLPAPTLKLLLTQILHHTPPPVNAGPTAFMVACGMDWYPEGNSPKFMETVPEDLPLLQAMLTHGANVRATTYEKLQALHFACEQGRLHTVELLLSRGADVNAPDTSHKTPLMYAAFPRTDDVMRLLLAHGADVRLHTTTGNTALHYAVALPDAIHTVSLLMAKGADPNATNKMGVSPLQYARKRKRADLIVLLTSGFKTAPAASYCP